MTHLFIWTNQSYTYHLLREDGNAVCGLIRRPERAVTDDVAPKALRRCNNCWTERKRWVTR